MTDALLELDSISRNFAQSQQASTTAFRELHSSVADISSRSRKIREATRSHLRALKNVTKTEKELETAIASYTIPEWLVRVGESCSRRPKGDVNCSTAELCKAMSRLVVSKAYLDSKPWNPVADSLEHTVDRYVKNIVAAAEDRVLLKFMHAIHLNSGGAGVGSPAGEPATGRNRSQSVSHRRGHSRTFSSSVMLDDTMGQRAASTTGGATQVVSSVAALFGESAPIDMLEASELLSSLFKNYCRIKSVLEVKAHILDKIYGVMENRIAEYRRLRIERGGPQQQSSSGFFSSSTASNETAPERLARALKELITNVQQETASRAGNSSTRLQLQSQLAENLSSALLTMGITDFPECIFGVSKAARDLSLDISSFLAKYVLSSIPPVPRRKTATEQLLDGTSHQHINNDQNSSPMAQESSSPTNADNFNDQDNNKGKNGKQQQHPPVGSGAPLDPEAADEIDKLRASVLAVPSQIVEITSTFALELLSKMVADLSAKEIYNLDNYPIILLEAVQEAWAWRHVAREISGNTEDLLGSIDYKVDMILQAAFASLANLRDEPGSLTGQSFLDLMLAPKSATFNSLSYDILYVTGINALAETQMLNRDNKRLMTWRLDDTFRRASWHPERDLYFGFSALLVDAMRRMISLHEATLHIVFGGSVDRVDKLIAKADRAIETKHQHLIKEAKLKQRKLQMRQAGGAENDKDNNNNNVMDLGSFGGTGGVSLSTMIEAESAAKGVFEYVRLDVESFFEDTLTHHLVWMFAVASAAFLLGHGTFDEDPVTGDMTSYCLQSGEEREDSLLWYEIPAGKLRFHPTIFRVNTLQKIIRRLSAPGVFDVAPNSQLVWSHTSTAAPVNNNNYAHHGGANNTTTSTLSPPAGLEFKKPDLSLFYSPSHEETASPPAATAQPAPVPQRVSAFGPTSSSASTPQQPTWRAQLLEKLLQICNEKLEQQIDIAGARWATILPNPNDNDVLNEIRASTDPLSHSERAEVKQWYWKATNAIYDEMMLWETGVIVVEDAGLRTTLGEASFDAAHRVFQLMENDILKGREWSTRENRWLKFPLENLERAMKTFRAPLLMDE